MAKLIELHPPSGQPRFYFNSDLWHAGQPHTDVATLLPRWYLLRKEVVPGSTGKSYDDLLTMLPPEYELPTTIAQTAMSLAVFQKTGTHPNPSKWACCAEQTIKTEKVQALHHSCVGLFDGYGLHVIHWNGEPSGSVGLGVSRKPGT